MKIYLVTTGEYSDYRVHSVWDDEEYAKKIAGVVGGEVDERELNSIHTPLSKEYTFWFWSNGELYGEAVGKDLCWDKPRSGYWVDSNANSVQERYNENNVRCSVCATDRDTAFKIALDVRTQYLAKLAGL